MTSYLRQIAARGAGLNTASTTVMTPPRTASFLIPSTIAPPLSYLDPAEANNPLDSQIAPARSSVDTNSNSATSTIPTASSSSALITRNSTAPTLLPAESHSKLIAKNDRAPNDSHEAETPMAQVEPTSVSIFPPSPVSTLLNEDRLHLEAPGSLPAKVEPSPSIQKTKHETVDLNDMAAYYKEAGIPRVVVRLEPALRASTFEFQAQPSALPLYAPERLTRTSQPRAEVRVTIGRVDVRLESNGPPAPMVNQSVASSDPFASLALMRRGWRTPF